MLYANMTGVNLDGIHGTAYIPAPLGSVMAILVDRRGMPTVKPHVSPWRATSLARNHGSQQKNTTNPCKHWRVSNLDQHYDDMG